MTRHLDVDRALDEWLAEGPSQLSDLAINAIVRQVDKTKQRRHAWLPRRETMNRTIFSIATAAVVVLLAVVALVYVNSGGSFNIGGPPEPSASQTPMVTPSPVALATGALEPGRYFKDKAGYRYTISIIEAGWAATCEPDCLLFRKGAPDDPDFANLWIWGEIAPRYQVYGEPCQWLGTNVIPGPTVDDLAAALAGLEGFETSNPRDVTIGGYFGKRLQLAVPQDAEFVGCNLAEYRSWDGRYYQAPGQVDDVRILDVDGTRLLLFTTSKPGTPAATLNVQQQMIESLEIEPLSD